MENSKEVTSNWTVIKDKLMRQFSTLTEEDLSTERTGTRRAHEEWPAAAATIMRSSCGSGWNSKASNGQAIAAWKLKHKVKPNLKLAVREAEAELSRECRHRVEFARRLCQEPPGNPKPSACLSGADGLEAYTGTAKGARAIWLSRLSSLRRSLAPH